MRRRCAIAVVLLILAATSSSAGAQVFPPGTFSVDGVPIICGFNTFILDPGIPDVGYNNGMGQIYLNPAILFGLPTELKLYWVGHECGHSAVGPNESAADCWSVRTGRDQGWFSASAFEALTIMFQSNPGDMAHPSGPERVAQMIECYES